MLGDDVIRSRTWCVFRNLVHAVYREVRHLGPSGDQDARVTVSDGPLLPSAVRSRNARAKLKSVDLHKLTAQARTVADVLKPYVDTTGLLVDEVIRVFKLPNWKRGYGGPKWARIAETLRDLAAALEAGDIVRASHISDSVSVLQHNSGPLVPSRSQWANSQYLQEKWPQLCD